MAREIGKLTALSVSHLKERGLYSDGGGLYLRITPTGGKFWAFRFMFYGKAREMGLGALHALPLAKARQKAAECRKLLSEGGDPITARTAAQTEVRLALGKDRTFRQCAEAYIEAHKDGWRNAKHIQQWTNTLKGYAYPVFGDISVQDINVAMVLRVLEPIWKSKTETATRLRGRIEVILDWAKVREYRRGENPARWRGHLENLLANPSKIAKIEHFPALPYTKINEFINKLEQQEGHGAQALKLVIYTACRSREVLEARWDEIDFEKRIWTIPAERMKMGREHRIPLTAPTVAILEKLKGEREGGNILSGQKSPHIFPSRNGKNCISNMVMLVLLKRMNRQDITVHGFRSTFRDWAAEQTNFPREVAEAALAHSVEDRVEAAYRRSDLFEKRRLMMEQWATYCQLQQSEGKVVEMMPKARKKAEQR